MPKKIKIKIPSGYGRKVGKEKSRQGKRRKR